MSKDMPLGYHVGEESEPIGAMIDRQLLPAIDDANRRAQEADRSGNKQESDTLAHEAVMIRRYMTETIDHRGRRRPIPTQLSKDTRSVRSAIDYVLASIRKVGHPIIATYLSEQIGRKGDTWTFSDLNDWDLSPFPLAISDEDDDLDFEIQLDNLAWKIRQRWLDPMRPEGEMTWHYWRTRHGSLIQIEEWHGGGENETSANQIAEDAAKLIRDRWRRER